MQGLDLSPLGLFRRGGPRRQGRHGRPVRRLALVLGADRRGRDLASCASAARCAPRAPAARSRTRLSSVAAAGDEEAHRRIPGETVSEVRARISDAMARAARELLDALRGRAAQSRGHLLGRAVRRPVRHGLGHHGELRRDLAGAGHEPRHRRARASPSCSPRPPTASPPRFPPRSATTASAPPTPGSARRWRRSSRSARWR